MRLSISDLTLLREWYNCVTDVCPEYMEKCDHDLFDKIKEEIDRLVVAEAE